MMEALANPAIGQRDGEPPRKRITPEEAKERMANFVPRDEFERRLMNLGSDWGVVLPAESLTSEGIYD